MVDIAPLRHFVTAFTELVGQDRGETELLDAGTRLLRTLVAEDDWLPEPFAAPDETAYRQYLLHCDPLERFSVVSFVWGPGQETPIHNHTVWGLIGLLRGAEFDQHYRAGPDGQLVANGAPIRLEPGDVGAVSPSRGDIHRVRNALPDRVSISIHVYGANIGAVRRAVFDPSGATKRFVSGYSNTILPNLGIGRPR
jgi:predicted metal-dependent enzyme (double-stranded beta helix superfamily)